MTVWDVPAPSPGTREEGAARQVSSQRVSLVPLTEKCHVSVPTPPLPFSLPSSPSFLSPVPSLFASPPSLFFFLLSLHSFPLLPPSPLPQSLFPFLLLFLFPLFSPLSLPQPLPPSPLLPHFLLPLPLLTLNSRSSHTEVWSSWETGGGRGERGCSCLGAGLRPPASLFPWGSGLRSWGGQASSVTLE